MLFFSSLKDFDFQAPAGHASLSQFSTSTPPATPLRNNSFSTTLPKSAASEDIFSPSLFGITMTPTTYNFSQLHGMTSSGTYLDSEGNVIYENMPPVPTSRYLIFVIINIFMSHFVDIFWSHCIYQRLDSIDEESSPHRVRRLFLFQ